MPVGNILVRFCYPPQTGSKISQYETLGVFPQRDSYFLLFMYWVRTICLMPLSHLKVECVSRVRETSPEVLNPTANKDDATEQLLPFLWGFVYTICVLDILGQGLWLGQIKLTGCTVNSRHFQTANKVIRTWFKVVFGLLWMSICSNLRNFSKCNEPADIAAVALQKQFEHLLDKKTKPPRNFYWHPLKKAQEFCSFHPRLNVASLHSFWWEFTVQY